MLDGTLHAWLTRYEVGGLAGLADRSKRPRSCPHQMAAEIEALVLEWRRQHPGWGPRRLLHELARAQVAPLPSRSGVYRLLVRHRLIDPAARRRRSEKWRRWERGSPMELWQLDVVGGIALADGAEVKALTGLDDHSPNRSSERSREPCSGARRVLLPSSGTWIGHSATRSSGPGQDGRRGVPEHARRARSRSADRYCAGVRR
jgi:hypothetical protein